jgi:hypothetical protein
MYRNTLTAAMLLLSLNVSAQVTSPLLNCLDDEVNFSFTAKFNGQTATVTFKGWTYDLRFAQAFVSKKGERFSTYQNQEIVVYTTFPFDKYVTVNTMQNPSSLIAATHCK